MSKVVKRILFSLIALYVLLCGALYFFQEKLIFFPEKLAPDFQFHFDPKSEEINILTKDNTFLNAVLFHTDSSKGLIFYLHGNAGSLKSWGSVAQHYTALHYDVFMLDYRGYGKSSGRIHSQERLFEDNQTAYNAMKKRYPENKIIILGYSIGSGLATKLASSNKPNMLILQAPYYSLTDMMKQNYPFIPTFILKYKLETNKYIQECKMPIVLFHGIQDAVIDHHASIRLKDLLKPSDRLILLPGQGHNGMTDNREYHREIKGILAP